MTPRCLTGANTWMTVIFISRVSEHWKRGEERGDECLEHTKFEVFMGHPSEKG